MIRCHNCRAVDETHDGKDESGRQETDGRSQHEIVPVRTKQLAVVIIEYLARRSARGDIDLVAIMLGTADAVMAQVIETLQVIGDTHEHRHHLAHAPVPAGIWMQQSVYRLVHHHTRCRSEQQGRQQGRHEPRTYRDQQRGNEKLVTVDQYQKCKDQVVGRDVDIFEIAGFDQARIATIQAVVQVLLQCLAHAECTSSF
ncbi:hypothetical protein D3C77_548680 [compost metagenome]